MSGFLLTVLNGISQGVLLFLVASGLSLIFGVMGVLNFAHGGFFALGAFLIYSLTAGAAVPAPQYLALVIVASLGVGLLGMIVEAIVFRRIYHLEPIDALLATYAVLLTIQGAITQVWGVNPLGQPMPRQFQSAMTVAGATLPIYDFVLLVIGAIVVVAVWWLLQRTSLGRSVRAIAADRTMSASLGIDTRRIFTLMFGLGAALAGLGGALIAPLVQIDTSLAATFVIQSFAVVIVGGLGNMYGALVAAILLGLLNSVLVGIDPSYSDFSLYLGMAVILLIRPQGLFGVAVGERR